MGFFLFFFSLYFTTRLQLQYTSGFLNFSLFVCFFAFYQFSFSRHWVVALLHQQNYHQTGRKTETFSLQVCSTLPFFVCFFFAYQCVEHSLLHRLTFGETEPGTDGKKSGRHSVFLQLQYSLVFTRERLTIGWPWISVSVGSHESCCPESPRRRLSH